MASFEPEFDTDVDDNIYNQKMRDLVDQVSALKTQLEEKDAQIDTYGRQVNGLNKQVSDLTSANHDLYEKGVDKEKQIEEGETRIERLQQENNAARTSIFNANYGTNDLQKQLKEKADQFAKEKKEHDDLKGDKRLLEIQNDKLRKEMNKIKDMLKDQTNEREDVQRSHDELVAGLAEKEEDIKEQAGEIEQYVLQRQRDLQAIRRLDEIHNILATHLDLDNTLDIKTAPPADISGMIQELVNPDRSRSPDADALSPMLPKGVKLAGRPSTTRHVSLSDQLGDQSLSDSEGEEVEMEEGKQHEAEVPAVVVAEANPAGLGLVDVKLPELVEEPEKDREEQLVEEKPDMPAAIVVDTEPTGQVSVVSGPLPPSKSADAVGTSPSPTTTAMATISLEQAGKGMSVTLPWWVWLFFALAMVVVPGLAWRERQLWLGANDFSRQAVVQSMELGEVIFGRRSGSQRMQQLLFSLERRIGTDTGVLG